MVIINCLSSNRPMIVDSQQDHRSWVSIRFKSRIVKNRGTNVEETGIIMPESKMGNAIF